MTCRVVSLTERGSEPLVDFYVRPSGVGSGKDHVWDLLLRKLVERCPAASDRLFEPELFLFFLGDEMRHGPEPAFLADLLDASHESSLGSPIYLVTPANLLPSRESHLPWLEVATEHRVGDLLQVPYLLGEPESISPLLRRAAARLSLLEEACERADQRLQLLRNHELQGRWHCYAPPGERPRYARLLLQSLPPTAVSSAPEASDYLLVVADQSEPPESQMWVVEDAYAEFPGHELLVALLPPVEASKPLKDFCQKHSVVPRPVSFSGYLELWFFYRRLRMPSRLWPPRELELEEVGAGPPPLLPAATTTAPPRVLLTCAWSVDLEAVCQHLGRDVRRLLSRLPLTTRYHVEPAIDPGRLSRYLELDATSSAGHAYIWVHLGPGHAGGAIPDYSGRPLPPEDWLEPFLEHEIGVPLALFLCDGSTVIARRFAEAGASVAVGFAEKPLARGSRRLATDILNCAVRHGVHPEALLRVLDSGHLDSASEIAGARPSVFVSRPP